ncbi:amidohydrolase family protein [Sedimenticola hydrogenitrophicus]|uniref:amidohydrolase family protein n=1 Tax=Sedimenticola hydrogenitrophicus TaxID=2967975 RepID=UPI0021A8ADD4|nr:amidohydrolase family protein [Sedimenticola hydrogenitrophicus]
MKTVDIHTHLLNPEVSFHRLYDKITIPLFARSLGADPKQLLRQPYATYVSAMAASIKNSVHVEKSCLFGVDVRLDERGREIDRDRTVCAMTEDVLTVARRYPDQFIPFFSVNPRRPDALELIDRHMENGCRGAKFLQNYWGVDLNDERFIPYYEKIEAHNIPLIIHVGSEYSIDSHRRYEGVGMLDLPLATGVTVIAAHMGLGRLNYKLRLWRNLSKDPRFFDADYFQLLAMLKAHPNLYADISAILAPMRARALRHLSEQTDVHHKLLFGTDYPVPFTVRFNSYDLPKQRRKRIGLVGNPFDRYIAALHDYFPSGNPLYTNYTKLL